jgi:hypothetical protein
VAQEQKMFLSILVVGIENALMAIEASNVIAMRLHLIFKGDQQGLRESELIWVAPRTECGRSSAKRRRGSICGKCLRPSASGGMNGKACRRTGSGGFTRSAIFWDLVTVDCNQTGGTAN